MYEPKMVDSDKSVSLVSNSVCFCLCMTLLTSLESAAQQKSKFHPQNPNTFPHYPVQLTS